MSNHYITNKEELISSMRKSIEVLKGGKALSKFRREQLQESCNYLDYTENAYLLAIGAISENDLIKKNQVKIFQNSDSIKVFIDHLPNFEHLYDFETTKNMSEENISIFVEEQKVDYAIYLACYSNKVSREFFLDLLEQATIPPVDVTNSRYFTTELGYMVFKRFPDSKELALEFLDFTDEFNFSNQFIQKLESILTA